ncbi:MAG: phosphoribosylglycinamide formyltransferase [Firmicutes bacterium HGW-Firmicutes-15]|nr:MAG: phosphoribosylglycinamide formyltransferase [Firmicutes bacterium HGW-Firmicutes-15]
MMRVMEPGRLKLAVLASGRGSNFLALWEAIQKGELDAEICLLISDKEEAPALGKAVDAGITALFIDPRGYQNREQYEAEIVAQLVARNIDIVVLAGYMRLVGKVMLDAYKMRIVNIHPALLPSFTGLNAQQQALDYGVKVSGCTVHFVDEGMDTGPIIMQAVVVVYPNDNEDSLSARILVEEHRSYCQALQLLAEGRVFIKDRTVHIN